MKPTPTGLQRLLDGEETQKKKRDVGFIDNYPEYSVIKDRRENNLLTW